jgi:hypothetical protein
MKTAISIPDVVFTAAEKCAKKMHKSRSQLYVEAMVEYLERHIPDTVTSTLNSVLSDIDSPEDDFAQRASNKTLKSVEW